MTSLDNLEILETAEGYFELGMFDMAITSLNQLPALTKIPRNVALLKCRIFSAEKRWIDLQALAMTLVIDDPDFPRWWIWLISSTYMTRGVSDAHKEITRLEKNHGGASLIFYGIACFLCEEELVEEAKILLTMAFEEDPSLRSMAFEEPALIKLWTRLDS